MKTVLKLANVILGAAFFLWAGALVLYVFTTVDVLSFQQWEDRKLVGSSHKTAILPAGVEIRAEQTTDDPIDTARFNEIQLHLVHNKPTANWPVKTGFPLPGALLPYHRIVAFYGNLYSSQMGILGALPGDEMMAQLAAEVNKWKQADTCMPVVPALHYIAVTAQKSAGKDKKYRLRMPDTEINKVFSIAKKSHAIVFLDIQPGWSSLQEELPLLEKYLLRPDVHLGIDPEYSMKSRQVPCTAIGTLDAEDINDVIDWLAGLVKQHHLPPKILIVHRFTAGMVTNYKKIRLRPEVQLVMNMDGFGGIAKKTDSYKCWIAGEPVQFTGFKLFYKNDITAGGHLMDPAEVLMLYPQPVYIQYQ